jgi:RNA-directed DNA polymerase
MARLGRWVGDKRMLRIIGRFLRAGLMQNGVCVTREEGTPQGGPLSPLLANLLLDDLDKELDKRGHTFCRYADDCNIYVQSEASGQRVLASVTKFLEGKLKLRVNRDKRAVAPRGGTQVPGPSSIVRRETGNSTPVARTRKGASLGRSPDATEASALNR